jgi:outer membrane lipoprotein-sorting protein
MQFGNGVRSWQWTGVALVGVWLLAACAQAQTKAATPTPKAASAAAKVSDTTSKGTPAASKASSAAAKATGSDAKANPAAAKDAPLKEAPLEDAPGPARASASAPAAATARATSVTETGRDLSDAPAPMGQASPEVVALLERITKAHGAIKTLTAEFDQVKIWKPKQEGAVAPATAAVDEIKSNGRVYLQMPDRLRCEYDKPDPSRLLFADKTFYQYVESLAQVDRYSYASEEEARERFRMMLLGFGVSGDQVLSSYNVTQEPADAKEPGTTVLVFVPVHPDIVKVVARIVVWFDSEKWLPRKVEIDEVSDDVTTVTIRPGTFKINPTIAEKLFRPDWPKKNAKGQPVLTIDH